MKLIRKLVIPKILSHWESLADSLQLEASYIAEVKKRCGGDQKKCCIDMIESWISSDRGVDPKTWPVLLQAIARTSPELASVANNTKEELIKL